MHRSASLVYSLGIVHFHIMCLYIGDYYKGIIQKAENYLLTVRPWHCDFLMHVLGVISNKQCLSFQ